MEKNIGERTNYFYEIAFEFLSRIKRGYFLSPLEIDLIKKWESKKIPLKIIKKSLIFGFKNSGKKRNLLYFKKIVDNEVKKSKNNAVSKGKEEKQSPEENIKEQINIINSDYFRNRYEKFNCFSVNNEEKEKFDNTIDKELIEFYYDEKKIENEWNQKFQYIKVGEKQKKRLMEKYFIIKKREELHLFYFSYL